MRATRYLARLVAVGLVLALLAGLTPARTMPAQAVSPDVVISQVYGGGGNKYATLKNDFIELFNRGTTAVEVGGWSVQYASAGGDFYGSANMLTPLPDLTIAPGQYLLIQEAQGSGGTEGLPTPYVTDASPISMSASSGKVALVNTTTPLGCNGSSEDCSPEAVASIVDLVGWGSANYYEGLGPAPGTSNTTAVFRKGDGSTDTDDNAADFEVGAPDPRSTVKFPITVSSTTPGDGAGCVSVDTEITVTFSEPVNVSEGWFSISCSQSGDHTATASGGPETFTLDLDSSLMEGESCTVTIFAAGVSGQDEADPPGTMAADYSWSFSAITPPVPIHEIQGAGHVSPLAGQTLCNVQGIVTLIRSAGFYMQDRTPDDDPATSEGIYVYTGSTPAVTEGDLVAVAGQVSEYRPGGSSGSNLSTTELGSPSITVLSSGNPLPAPVVIGTDRIPPTAIIEDDAEGSVETSGVFDPEQDGLDFWESLEGMLVELDNPVAVGPTNSYGELPLVASDAVERTPRGGIVVQDGDYNPERIILDDTCLYPDPMPELNVGDSFAGAVIGALDYNFGNFMLEVTQLPPVSWNGLAREVAAPAGKNELAVAAFNVENLAPDNDPAKFERLADLIVNNLQAPDLIAVEEIQDNSGAADDGTVAADTTCDMLVEAIRAAGGPSYDYRQINPLNDEDGGQPGGNIRQGFLFRTDRGLGFIDRPGGDATTATSVVSGPAGPELSYSPGRIDPESSAFLDSRKPLAGEFVYNGHKLFVIANHFASKSGDDPLCGRFQPPVLASAVQREAQAQAVHGFVQSILDADPNADVIVLGDLNDFQFSPPITTLKGEILEDLIDTLPVNERYTYVYEGNSETLDHTLLSQHLFGLPYAYDVVHVNAEFADQASDHDPQVVRIALEPAPGFVTGGGWLATADGKATAELACKYVNGQVPPTGEFVFALPGLSFESTGYQWLFVSGATAQCVGTGTIEGQTGTFEFAVSVTDNGKPGKSADELRVVIGAKDGTLVYDSGTATLGGGSITVHE